MIGSVAEIIRLRKGLIICFVYNRVAWKTFDLLDKMPRYLFLYCKTSFIKGLDYRLECVLFSVLLYLHFHSQPPFLHKNLGIENSKSGDYIYTRCSNKVLVVILENRKALLIKSLLMSFSFSCCKFIQTVYILQNKSAIRRYIDLK